MDLLRLWVIERFKTPLHAVLIAVCLLMLTAQPLSAAPDAEAMRTPAEGRVIRLTLPVDNQPVSGTIVGYNTLLFVLRTDAGAQHRVLWNTIPGSKVDRYWRYLELPEKDPAKLIELGGILIYHSQGESLAEQAFKQALAIDPKLTEAVEQARVGRYPDGTPRFIGTGDPEKWGKLSDERMQEGVESIRRFAEQTQSKLSLKLSLYESERFMLLTDVKAEQVQPIATKLTKTYRAIATLLGDDPDGNVFYGKCMVLLFDKRIDYLRFQQIMHDTDARGTGGLCHGFGNGHAHIALFSRSSDRQTHHILIHEFTHAYLHRYRSPVPLPDWINEGLAEHIAHQLEPAPGQNLYMKSRLAIEGKRGLGEGFFDQDGLEAWQYDIAGALTGYLIERHRPVNYAKFIQAIKSGHSSEKAIKSVYRTTPAELTLRFKRRLDRELNDKLGS